jgi:hypothetical protein
MEFNITKNTLVTPSKSLIYGEPGTGKSYLASYSNRPFFLALEKGCEKIPGVKKFSHVDKNGCEQIHIPADWDQMFAMMEHLANKETIKANGYKTVVLDSGMFIDKIMASKIMKDEPEVKRDSKMVKVTSIDMYGFMEGYAKLIAMWEIVVAWADKLNTLGIDVIFIAHAAKIKHTDLNGTDYKRIEPDLCVAMGGRHSVSDFLCARVDHVLYIESQAQVEKKKGYMGKAVNVAINGNIDQFNRPEIKLYTRTTNRFIAKVRVTDFSQVADVYDIDITNPETSKKIFEDLKK